MKSSFGSPATSHSYWKERGLAFYDALIVASALEAGCHTLLTEDINNGQTIEGRLTISNPFKP